MSANVDALIARLHRLEEAAQHLMTVTDKRGHNLEGYTTCGLAGDEWVELEARRALQAVLSKADSRPTAGQTEDISMSAIQRAELLGAAEMLLVGTTARDSYLSRAPRLADGDVAELEARRVLHEAITDDSAATPETDVRLVTAAKQLLKVSIKRGAELVRMKNARVMGDAEAVELCVRGRLAEVLARIGVGQ